MAIYRYRKLNENTLCDLEENTLRFSNIKSLNDPFEMWCNFEFNIPDPKTNKEDFIKYMLKGTSLTSKKVDELVNIADPQKIQEFIKQQKLSVERKYKKYRKKIAEETTFCCFSKKPDILLMWSHYGDGLNGICVEYDEKILEVNGDKADNHIFSVIYPENNKTPVIDLFDFHVNGNAEQFGRALFQTKSNIWRYEEEIRLSWKAKESYNAPINRESIKSIIFGKKVNKTWQNIIKKILKDDDVKFKTAVRSKSHYEITIKDI